MAWNSIEPNYLPPHAANASPYEQIDDCCEEAHRKDILQTKESCSIVHCRLTRAIVSDTAKQVADIR